jgi:hypothetical protein
MGHLAPPLRRLAASTPGGPAGAVSRAGTLRRRGPECSGGSQGLPSSCGAASGHPLTAATARARPGPRGRGPACPGRGSDRGTDNRPWNPAFVRRGGASPLTASGSVGRGRHGPPAQHGRASYPARYGVSGVASPLSPGETGRGLPPPPLPRGRRAENQIAPAGICTRVRHVAGGVAGPRRPAGRGPPRRTRCCRACPRPRWPGGPAGRWKRSTRQPRCGCRTAGGAGVSAALPAATCAAPR